MLRGIIHDLVNAFICPVAHTPRPHAAFGNMLVERFDQRADLCIRVVLMQHIHVYIVRLQLCKRIEKICSDIVFCQTAAVFIVVTALGDDKHILAVSAPLHPAADRLFAAAAIVAMRRIEGIAALGQNTVKQSVCRILLIAVAAERPVDHAVDPDRLCALNGDISILHIRNPSFQIAIVQTGISDPSPAAVCRASCTGGAIHPAA